MPSRLAKGPVKKRVLTDLLCCACFALFVLGFVVVGVIFGIKGDSLNYDQLLDSEGRACGVESSVRDYKYLYMIKFSKNYRSVCVKECPVFDYNQIKYNSTGTNTTYIRPVYFENLSAVIDYSVRNDIGSDSTSNAFDFDEAAASGYYTRQQWDDYLARLQFDCKPNEDVRECKHSAIDGVFLYDSRQSFNILCTPISPRVAASVSKVGDISGNWTRDIKIAKWMIFIALMIAFVLSIVFIYLSGWMMKFIIWIQLTIAIVFMVALAIILWILAFSDHSMMLNNNSVSPATIRAYRSLKNHKVNSW